MPLLAEVITGVSDTMFFWSVVGTVAVVAILSTAITSVLSTRAREKTRREIAAYLAEGSIDKDTALAMMRMDNENEEEEAET